jgi:competence protein ComEC
MVGIAAERWLEPGRAWLAAASLCLLLWLVASWYRLQPRMLRWTVYGLIGVVAAWWHFLWQHTPLNQFVDERLHKNDVVIMRGVVLEAVPYAGRRDPLSSFPGREGLRLVLDVYAVSIGSGEIECRGRCYVQSIGRPAVSVGDHIEARGKWQPPGLPENPGERSLRTALRDRGIAGTVRVAGPDDLRKLPSGPGINTVHLLWRLRKQGASILEQGISHPNHQLARGLLLGEVEALEREEIAAFRHAGVYHVLAISGQHLSILCGFLWYASRGIPVGRKVRALGIGVLALLYAGVVGGRPPIVRAAVMVGMMCLGVVVRRQVHPINSLAAAALVIMGMNPTHIFQVGTQISFVAVLILIALCQPLLSTILHRQEDPLDRLITKPLWRTWMGSLGRAVGSSYLTTGILWLGITPLLVAHFHIVSPVALVISPLVVALVTVILMVGFVYLVVAHISLVAATPLGLALEGAIYALRGCVHAGEALPGSHFYCAGPGSILHICFYAGVITTCLWMKGGGVRYWSAGILAVAAIWLITPARIWPAGELRCAILSVGHGSCVVCELPCGRVLLYDAGSLRGPQVGEWSIAPYLWSRGIPRLDEILVSHADLDHYNALPWLVERFSPGMITATPSYFAIPEPGVETVRQTLTRLGIAHRVVSAGQRLSAGDVSMYVLHPPASGPPGSENARSLVVLIVYRGQTMLLTGDLENPGLEMVMELQPPRVDVLVAPHHGSAASNTARFAQWARPKLVVVSDGGIFGRPADPYSPLGAVVWRTSEEGAVIVRLTRDGIRAETFRSKKTWQSND